MNNNSNNSSIRKIRQNFSRQIRKSQIQKIHKEKRQKYMKSHNPLFYLEKTKKQIMTQNLQVQKIIQSISFISQNIKNQQFALLLEKEQLIEIIILKTIQVIQPWIHKDSMRMSKKFSQYCLFPGRCECLDCSQNSTSISQSFQGQYFHEEIDFDRKNYMQRDGRNDFHKTTQKQENSNDRWYSLLSDLLDLLNVVFQIVSFQNSSKCSQRPQNFISYEDRQLLKKFRFKDLFMQTPQLLQGLLLDLLNYQKNAFFRQNIQRQVQNIQLRYPLIFRIVSLLSKYVQISCFDEDQWKVILEHYVNYSMKIKTEVKNQFQSIQEIKEILILLSKSYLSKDIFSNTKFINQINKLIFPWIKSINQIFTEQNNRKDGDHINLSQDFTEEFGYALRILQDLKFLEKNINQEIKLILGEILNISTNLEKAGNTSQVNYFHLSPKIYQKKEFQIQRKCKLYAEKLIEILYLQMQLTQDDLNMIVQVQPSMQAKIQKIIDADCY